MTMVVSRVATVLVALATLGKSIASAQPFGTFRQGMPWQLEAGV